jgi:hypothetical protein
MGLPYPGADMKFADDLSDSKPAQIAKAIGDLDELVKAVLAKLPPAKPWQRQVLQHLAEIDRRAQVLRMTVALGRVSSEVSEARDQLSAALRAARQYVVSGRANPATKAAIEWACELGRRIENAFS